MQQYNAHILLKQFHLITLGINTVEHPWFSPCSWRTKVMFNRRSVDFKMILVPFMSARSKFLCVATVTLWSWRGLWRHCWRRQWLGRVQCIDWEWGLCIECTLRFRSYFVLFSWLFDIPCYIRKEFGMVARALWRSEAFCVMPLLHPCTRLQLGQCLRSRKNPVSLWSPQHAGKHSYTLYHKITITAMY